MVTRKTPAKDPTPKEASPPAGTVTIRDCRVINKGNKHQTQAIVALADAVAANARALEAIARNAGAQMGTGIHIQMPDKHGY